MMSLAATLLEPAASVPMASEIGGILWNHNQMTDACLDERLAARAYIGLSSLVRLNRLDDLILELPELVCAFDYGRAELGWGSLLHAPMVRRKQRELRDTVTMG